MMANIMLQSTSLLRGKTFSKAKGGKPKDASIHFPLAREDTKDLCAVSMNRASIHFPLAREDVVKPKR